jgi:hypothetical protein
MKQVLRQFLKRALKLWINHKAALPVFGQADNEMKLLTVKRQCK